MFDQTNEDQTVDDQVVEVPKTASDEEKALQDPTDRPSYVDEKSPALLDSGEQEGEN